MSTYHYLIFFDKVNFKMKTSDEMMLGIRSCRRGQEQWALACTLLVGTKSNCGWICSWPCEPCAYLPEVVHARSGHSVGRWVGPRDPLIQVRTSSMAVLFGKHSRPERLRRVLRSPSMVESARGRPIFLDVGRA